MTIAGTAFEVSRADLAATRFISEVFDPDKLAAEGRALLAIERFALTANNITYAAYGEDMAYWSFFPAGEGFGRVPVWGYAEVVVPAGGLDKGERIYGYFPMSSHLVVEPTRVSPRRFVDGAEHRRALPAVYNSYVRLAADPTHRASDEPATMLLKPLAITSFLITDWLGDNDFFGARQVLISSASSKTSAGLGFCLRRLSPGAAKTIGLTSASNAAFTAGKGWYDEVVTYEAIGALDPNVPTVFVDMAGSAEIISRVHHHFRGALVHSCRVGATHWEDKAGRLDLPGARPRFFFAPDQIKKRNVDWGPDGLEQRFSVLFADFAATSGSWMIIEEGRGEQAVAAAYAETLAGKVAPSRGVVLRIR